MKKILLFAGIVIIIVIVAAVVYMDKITEFDVEKTMGFAAEKSIGILQTAVIENLPETVSEDSVQAIFNGMADKIKSGDISAKRIQELLNAYRASQGDNKLDSLEVTSLMQSLEQLQK